MQKWIGDALSGRSRLRTKAHGEMLIRRRVDVIRELVKEFQLAMTVSLVRPEHNPADELTRVPKEWLRAVRLEEPTQLMAAAAAADRRTDLNATKFVRCTKTSATRASGVPCGTCGETERRGQGCQLLKMIVGARPIYCQGRCHEVLIRVDGLRCVKPTYHQILISPRISVLYLENIEQ